MKTRIRVIEYNNGKKDFICEYMGINWDVIVILIRSIIGIPPALILLIISPFTWEIMKKKFDIDVDNPRGKRKDAIFNNIEDAKKFIDEKLKEEADIKYKKHQESVKKTYKIKHP